MKEKIRLLNVYAGQDGEPQKNPLQELFPEADVTHLPISEILEWTDPPFGEEPMESIPFALAKRYEIIYCAHALTLVEAKDVPATIRKMAALLNERGELWLTVPSLEWAAREIGSENPSPAIHTVIYGDQAHPARCGFTLAWLRQLVEAANLIPRKAYHSLYRVAVKDQEIQIPLAVCIGWKVS